MGLLGQDGGNENWLDIGKLCVLAPLEHAYPGDDGPAIGYRYLITHGRHVADALAYDLEELSVFHCPCAVRGQIDGAGKAAQRIDTLSVPGPIMANAAIDVESFLAAGEQLGIDRHWNAREIAALRLAKLESTQYRR